jgi:hypothetical protein
MEVIIRYPSGQRIEGVVLAVGKPDVPLNSNRSWPSIMLISIAHWRRRARFP